MNGNLRILQVDAFTDVPFKGNPAGVVTDARGLSDELMQSIANEMNVSETAFVLESEDADFRLRYFTPYEEVDLCGHATIGSVFAMAEEGAIALTGDLVTVHLETNVGVLPVDIESEAGKVETVIMTQDRPRFRRCETGAEEIANILGIPYGQIAGCACPVGIAYTGLWHLLVPVDDIAFVREMEPDFRRLGSLNRDLGVDTTHVFTFLAEETGSDLHARDFAPAGGIDEDPATGTANGALGAFLVENRVAEISAGAAELTIEQGYEIGRESRVKVEVLCEEDSPAVVRVGGSAVISLKGSILL